MSGDLTSWVFEDEFLVRTVIVDGDPWWVANDVCGVLGLANKREPLVKLDADEKGVHQMDTLGGPQRMNIVSEPGLYKLVFRSDKPVARRFDRWVRHEVLPSIRKTGSYTVDRKEPEEARSEVGASSNANIAELRRQPFRTRAAYCESVRLGCGSAAFREMLAMANLPVSPAILAEMRALNVSAWSAGADLVAVLDRFVSDCVREKRGSRVQARAMYQAYEVWSAANELSQVSENKFGRTLKQRLKRDDTGSVHAYLDCILDGPSQALN